MCDNDTDYNDDVTPPDIEDDSDNGEDMVDHEPSGGESGDIAETEHDSDKN